MKRSLEFNKFVCNIILNCSFVFIRDIKVCILNNTKQVLVPQNIQFRNKNME